MKTLLLALLVTISYSQELKWTKHDILNLSQSQKEILDISYLTGSLKGYGLELAAIALVENSLKMKDYNVNHICGPHQVNARIANVSCKLLEDNPYLSSKLALDNLLYWEYRTIYNRKTNTKIHIKRSKKRMLQMYNDGYMDTKFGKETHLKKLYQAMSLLKTYYFKED